MLDSLTAQTPVETTPVAGSDNDQPATDQLDGSNDAAPRYLNSVDATVGQPIVDRVLHRKQELETALACLSDEDVRERGDLERALSTIADMLTGDLEHVPAVTVANMSLWLERNKHLAENAVVGVTDPVTAPVVVSPTCEPEPAAHS